VALEDGISMCLSTVLSRGFGAPPQRQLIYNSSGLR
jgi:hypothetical protein